MLALDSREDKDIWEIAHSFLLIAESFQVPQLIYGISLSELFFTE